LEAVEKKADELNVIRTESSSSAEKDGASQTLGLGDGDGR